MKVLLTTCSYQDTPGPHHELMESQGWDITRERGPLSEARMLELAEEGFDAFLCGDDAITRAVLEKCLPKLKIISKYGIGLDKMDIPATKELGIPVLFTPGVNHDTVAEHTFALLLALTKGLYPAIKATKAGKWTRETGYELYAKRIGLIGLGRIGQEMAKRATAFGMEVHAFGNYWPEEIAEEYRITRHHDLNTLFEASEIISPHTKLTADTHECVNAARLNLMPDNSWLLNTGRGELINQADVIAALDSGKLAGYGTDVLDEEPPAADHPLLRHPKVIVTPHIGSRTFESVPRQAMKSLTNLINAIKGEGETNCANGVI
ncbi:phosphoglycerate dehydrogenase [Luteolibacter algae]|uniref:Phosphoglycerate dehydrogenase n=1 Tax=Luteolibacter algae TaxID=454151 RepID=A0ABW5D8Z3_9BACT